MTGRPAKPTTPLTHTSATPAIWARASGPATTSVPAGTRDCNADASDWSAMATYCGRSSLAWATSASTERPAPMATTW